MLGWTFKGLTHCPIKHAPFLNASDLLINVKFM